MLAVIHHHVNNFLKRTLVGKNSAIKRLGEWIRSTTRSIFELIDAVLHSLYDFLKLELINTIFYESAIIGLSYETSHVRLVGHYP